MSAWRLVKNGDLKLGCSDSNADRIAGFKNLDIIETKSGLNDADIIFVLSNGYELQILATDTYESWLLHLEAINTSFMPYIPIIEESNFD